MKVCVPFLHIDVKGTEDTKHCETCFIKNDIVQIRKKNTGTTLRILQPHCQSTELTLVEEKKECKNSMNINIGNVVEPGQHNEIT